MTLVLDVPLTCWGILMKEELPEIPLDKLIMKLKKTSLKCSTVGFFMFKQ
jgi:hypothetical protein